MLMRARLLSTWLLRAGGRVAHAATATLLAVSTVLLSASTTSACWAAESVTVEKQLSKATEWGIIRVIGLSYTGLHKKQNPSSGEETGTWVDFTWMDVRGREVRASRFWFDGADVEGGASESTMPKLEVGRDYVVLLRWKKDRLHLVNESASVMEIENLEKGVLSPWDSVDTHGRTVVPIGAKKAVDHAQLFEVIDSLAATQNAIAKAGAK